jgi:hypothetical protein
MSVLADTLEHQLLLLTRPVRALKRFGVKDALKERFEHTWHLRPLSSHWAATIGMWGGVHNHTDIMQRSNTNYVALKNFKAQNGLVTRVGTMEVRKPQWVLAVDVFSRWQVEKMRAVPMATKVIAVSSHFGILPVEARIYIDHITSICDDVGFTPVELLDNYDTIEIVWDTHHAMIDDAVVSSYRPTHADD